jgi:hypothetical protein
MHCIQRNQPLRIWMIFILASILVVPAVVLPSSRAIAAQCNPSLPVDATGGSASCDVSVAAQISSGPFTLAADSSASVPGSPFTLTGIDIVANFHFQGYIKDHRGSSNGGRLLGSSAGISNGSATFPLSIISASGLTCTNGTCPNPGFFPATPLTTTPATIFTTGDATHSVVVDGDYTAQINGQFTIPRGSSNGIYSGVITATLLNSF